jgi:hypothetical protein
VREGNQAITPLDEQIFLCRWNINQFSIETGQYVESLVPLEKLPGLRIVHETLHSHDFRVHWQVRLVFRSLECTGLINTRRKALILYTPQLRECLPWSSWVHWQSQRVLLAGTVQNWFARIPMWADLDGVAIFPWDLIAMIEDHG